MTFRRAVQRYGQTPQPVTPYARAGQVWDDRIGSARVQARNGRLMAFCSLGLAIGMAGAFVWQAGESRVIPYVVEVDRLGEPRALSEAEKAHRPTDPQIAWHLAEFIGNVRSVSMDPVLMRRDWLSAYDFVTPKAAQFLGKYARASDPFARVGAESVSVQVTSVVRASDRSFQVKWTESVYARGSLADTSQWTAILAIETRVPETADTLRKNPLGIYVDAIAWSRELEPAAAHAPAPRRNAASQSPAIEELQP